MNKRPNLTIPPRYEQTSQAQQQQNLDNVRRVIHGNKILSAEVERNFILEPILARGEAFMLYAPTGQGKTFNALNLGICLATGHDFYKWTPNGRYNVLYLDGEMQSRGLVPRIQKICTQKGITDLSGFFMQTPDIFPDKTMRSISDKKNQVYYDQIIAENNIDVIILDNYNTLTAVTNVSESEMYTWQKLEHWIKQLKARGITVVLIHHTNKQNQQASGTVKKDNLMDLIVRIQHSLLSAPNQKLIDFQFEKLRDGEKPEDLLVELSKTDQGYVMELRDAQKMLRQRIKEDLKISEEYVNKKYSYLKHDLIKILWEMEEESYQSQPNSKPVGKSTLEFGVSGQSEDADPFKF